MSWKDRLRPASFKGAAFQVDATAGTFGRRVSVLRLAGGKATVQQDHGQEPREFDVTAFVWGDNYDLARDALERALSSEGPGKLILPSRGELWARISRPGQTQETKQDGGYASIRFSVVIEREDQGPEVQVDTAQRVAEASQYVRQYVVANAEERINPRGLSTRQLERVGALVQSGTAILSRLNRTIAGALEPVNALTRDVDALNSQAVKLLATPQSFATSIIDLVLSAFAIPESIVAGGVQAAGVPGTFVTAFGRGRAARLIDRAARGMRGLGEPFGVRVSSLEQQAEANVVAAATAFRAAALTAQADAYAELPFDSATFAVGAYARTLAEIDAVQALEPTDGLFVALDDLRAALGSHIYATASKLPETITIEVRRPLPALVLAHKLYGDARQEEDIVARNRIPNPAWISGRIEVLRP